MSQILTELDVLAAGGQHERRRSEPRIVCDRAISLVPCEQAETLSGVNAQLTDCSLHGLGLMLPRRLESGQQVLVKIALGGHQPTLLMYTLRYCIPTQPDRFRAGAKFTGLAASKFRGELSAVVSALTGATDN